MSLETAKSFIRHLQEGDVASAASLLDEDAVWRQPGQTRLSGDHRGRAAILELLAAFAGLGIGIELADAYACDEAFLCRIIIRHRIGDQHEFQLIGVRGGRVQEIRHFGDTDYLSAIFQASDQR